MGMDDEMINAIFEEKPQQNGISTPPKMHIGIKNVDERIKHRYGLSFGISISSQYGLGTKVSILVPADGSKPIALETENENRHSR